MADIAIFRINYKSDFILTLNSDAGWMTPFCIKFWTGAPSQAYFVGFDGTTYTHCAPVDGEPTKLLVQFDDHHLPIGDLKFQIGYHFTVADFPTSVEDEVVNQASVIIEVDDAPAQVMLDLNGETAPEIEFSLPAYANEQQRIANEEQRIANEEQRIANEEARIAAETVRQQNEEQRISQETARVNEFARLKRESEAATDDANTAATLANEKAALADDKAALADVAATLANEKAQLAADKAALAQAAATLANDKAALAQQKAEYAQTQGDYAKTQGDYAKEQGEIAEEDHDRAEADHTRAESDHTTAGSDHTQAGTDHTRAESDHTQAGADHTQADTDHTRAESDHTQATSDHTQAGADHTRAESDHTTASADHTQAGQDHTRAESDHTRAESDHAAVEVYVDSLGVFDLSKHNAVGGVLATYADLSAALTALNALESKYKYGGMSFKFVQSSDNKYVQFRLMANDWSIDTEDWAIADEGVYVENPEFVYVQTDKEGKILYGVKQDGSMYFGEGCPTQVKDYINERIAELSLDEYESIVSFLNNLEFGDKTLQDLLDEKVDKEEGKSLMDAEYASTKSSIDNPEFHEVTLDAEDKVLEGIKQDGTKVIGGDLNVGGSANLNGDLRVLGNMEVSGVSYKVIDNSEYLAAWVDAEDKIIFGFKADGKTYVGDADFLNDIENIKDFLQNITDKDIDWDALSSITAVENPELIEAKIDSEDKLLAGRTSDGAAFENVGFSAPKVSIDGHIIENIEDPEGRSEITTDSEGKIISYRDADGVKHEEVGIESDVVNTNSLNLTAEGMTEFQQALKDAGFNPGGAGDFSDVITKKGKNPVYISEPRCASLNIISNIDLTALSKSDRPDGVQKVNYDVKCQIEFFDGHGIYFKKTALIGGQGSSSMNLKKKNIALKIFDTDNVEDKKGRWGKGDTFGIKFGDWVMQKSFHLKSFYTDFVRGASAVAYKISDSAYKTRGIFEDRPWKKALIDFSAITDESPTGLSADGINDMNLQIDNGAKCMPDGFPVIIYQNGVFYGIFSWQIKKDSDNYNMDTDNPLHIHLDGVLNPTTFFNGNIDWTQFEVRCPEGLKDINGNDYDGDNPTEIEEGATKDAIVNFSRRIGEINALHNTNPAAAKELFDTYFDADNIIDYQLINMALCDQDAFSKNWQWITYDGIKWYVCQYDKDQSFGGIWNGIYTRHAGEGWFGSSNSLPTGLAIRYYPSEHAQRWNSLKESGIFTADYFIKCLSDWVDRIGKINYSKEWDKWPESPCNRDSNIDFENWVFEGQSSSSIPVGGIEWNSQTSYSENDEVWFRGFDPNLFLKFKAVSANINKPCLKEGYSDFPKTMGYRDSFWRICKFIIQNFINQNNFIERVN